MVLFFLFVVVFFLFFFFVFCVEIPCSSIVRAFVMADFLKVRKIFKMCCKRRSNSLRKPWRDMWIFNKIVLGLRIRLTDYYESL